MLLESAAPRADRAARPSSVPRARSVPQENVRSLLSLNDMGLRGDNGAGASTSSNPLANPMASASLDDDAAAGGNGARSGGSARPQSMVISAAGALSAGALMRRAHSSTGPLQRCELGVQALPYMCAELSLFTWILSCLMRTWHASYEVSVEVSGCGGIVFASTCAVTLGPRA